MQKVPIPSRAYLSDARGLEECFQEEGRDGIPVSGKETRAQIWEFPKVNTGLICLNILLYDFRSPCHSDDEKEEESVGINVGVYGPFTRFGMTRRPWALLQQVRSQTLGAFQGLLQLPLLDFCFVTREQNVGNFPSVVLCRTGVNRCCQEVVLERIR